MAGKIYVAKVTGLADYDGNQVTLVAGVTRVREGHPLLEGRESIFEEIRVDYDLEDARSAPQDESKPEPQVTEAKPEAAEGSGSSEEPEPKPKAAPVRRGPRKQAGS